MSTPISTAFQVFPKHMRGMSQRTEDNTHMEFQPQRTVPGTVWVLLPPWRASRRRPRPPSRPIRSLPPPPRGLLLASSTAKNSPALQAESIPHIFHSGISTADNGGHCAVLALPHAASRGQRETFNTGGWALELKRRLPKQGRARLWLQPSPGRGVNLMLFFFLTP